MKHPLVCVLLGLTLLSVGFGAESSDYKSEARSESEVFTSKVLKVYACQEAGAEFVAYVVNWRGHEVVVCPAGLTPAKRYEVGDAIRCQMHQYETRLGEGRGTRMTFVVFSAGNLLPGLGGAEQMRLDAVAAEVAERRRLREAALLKSAASENPPSPASGKE